MVNFFDQLRQVNTTITQAGQLTDVVTNKGGNTGNFITNSFGNITGAVGRKFGGAGDTARNVFGNAKNTVSDTFGFDGDEDDIFGFSNDEEEIRRTHHHMSQNQNGTGVTQAAAQQSDYINFRTEDGVNIGLHQDVMGAFSNHVSQGIYQGEFSFEQIIAARAEIAEKSKDGTSLSREAEAVYLFEKNNPAAKQQMSEMSTKGGAFHQIIEQYIDNNPNAQPINMPDTPANRAFAADLGVNPNDLFSGGPAAKGTAQAPQAEAELQTTTWKAQIKGEEVTLNIKGAPKTSNGSFYIMGENGESIKFNRAAEGETLPKAVSQTQKDEIHKYLIQEFPSADVVGHTPTEAEKVAAKEAAKTAAAKTSTVETAADPIKGTPDIPRWQFKQNGKTAAAEIATDPIKGTPTAQQVAKASGIVIPGATGGEHVGAQADVSGNARANTQTSAEKAAERRDSAIEALGF